MWTLSQSAFLRLRQEKAAMRAGRLMFEEIRRRVARGDNFAFETTHEPTDHCI
jgi:hypothetical protein